MSDMYKQPGNRDGKPGTRQETDFSDQTKSATRDLKGKAADLADTVTRTAKDQASQLGDAAKTLAANATDKVSSAMNDQKTAGANYIGSLAQAVDSAADAFDDKLPQAAQYIRQAAMQMESVAGAVRERDMQELLGEVQDFARRQPALFFGGAVILGFAAVRFFKSSAPRPSRQANTSGDHFTDMQNRQGVRNQPRRRIS